MYGWRVYYCARIACNSSRSWAEGDTQANDTEPPVTEDNQGLSAQELTQDEQTQESVDATDMATKETEVTEVVEPEEIPATEEVPAPENEPNQ